MKQVYEEGELVEVQQHWFQNKIVEKQFAIFLGPYDRYNNPHFLKVFLQNEMREIVISLDNLKKVAFEYYRDQTRKEISKETAS